MRYVNTYLLAVPEDRKDDYVRVAHKGMFADPRMTEIGDMPFDGKRMILGGFEPILAYTRD